jgi:hypothetical protein
MERDKIRIACIGNMNNALFCVTRHLRDAGYNADLLLLEEFSHFLPQSDSYEEDLTYVKQLNWYDIGHWAIDKKKIASDLDRYNFFIGTDLVPAFFEKAGLSLDIFIPHGGDIFHHCYYTFQRFPPKKYEIGAWWRSRQQIKGARKAKMIMLDSAGESFDKYFRELKIEHNRVFANAPYIYPVQYSSKNIEHSNQYFKAKEVKDKHDIVFFHQCRHVWKTHIDTLHYKANDRIIVGFKKFVDQNSEINPLLIMFEYGWDFEESKKLVTQLGIDKHVLWLPTMQRKDLMVWLYFADLGIGEVANSWFSYGSVYEVLTMKKPFLGFRNDKDFEKDYPIQYPMISANTADLISEAFQDVYRNPSKYKEMGQQGYEWFMRYAIEKPITEIVKQIESKK